MVGTLAAGVSPMGSLSGVLWGGRGTCADQQGAQGTERHRYLEWASRHDGVSFATEET